MSECPHYVHAWNIVESFVEFSSYIDHMDWKPADGIYDYHDYHHLDDLKEDKVNILE